MNSKILNKIKSKGYWRILFRPLTHEIRIKELDKCKEIVERNKVSLIGWDYPHFAYRRDNDADLVPGNDYYEGWTDWMQFKELWRMYQSGQFIHYVALYDDWYEEGIKDEWAEHDSEHRILKITETVFFITEVYEFLSRLTKARLFEGGVNVSLQLNNTKDRILYSEHGIGRRFLRNYKTGAPDIVCDKQYRERDIIENPCLLAKEALLHIFERFGWKPADGVIEGHQSRLLEKKR